MKPNYTVIIQSNTFGGTKVSFCISENKADKLFQLLEPEAKKKAAKENCSSITLERFFNGDNPMS